jgi:hypothetical protein
LATAKLVGSPVFPCWRQAHLGHHLQYPLGAFLATCLLAYEQWLFDDLSRGHARIQGACRILEYELNLASNTGLSSPALGHKILALKPDFSSVGLLQAYQAHSQGCLPATGFTD